jgi:ribose transport system permease protein
MTNHLSAPDSVVAPHDRPSEPQPGPYRLAGASLIRFAAQYAAVVVLLVLLIAATLVNDQFWTADNIRNVLTQNAPITFVAIGMTMVIISGAFDLSVGATFAAGGVVYAQLANDWDSLMLAACATILVGVAAGAINGLIVTKLRVNSFIGTIGTGAAFYGLVYTYSNSQPIAVERQGFETLGLGTVAGIPWAVIAALVAAAAVAFLLSRTVFGRHTYAVGGNAVAARLAGISVHRVQIVAFIVVASLAVMAGMVTASQISVGQPTLGANTALQTFAIVVIGGTSVYGGEGAIWRTLVGVLIVAVLNNTFNALAWEASRQSIVLGGVLVAAVALDAVRQSRNARG